MTELSKLHIWDLVSKTDPKHTKPVSEGGRKYTTIDAYWQIKRATEVFGPAGAGWGWRILDQGELATAVWIRLELWWNTDVDRSDLNSIEVYGGSRFMTKEGKPFSPDEAFKKAMTDAITKGLSYLGFSADVFTGQYDDNKYVAEMRRQFSGDESYQKLIAAIESASSNEDMDKIKTNMASEFKNLTPEKTREISEAAQAKRKSFSNT